MKWVSVHRLSYRFGKDESKDYSKRISALKRRFDPESKRTLHENG